MTAAQGAHRWAERRDQSAKADEVTESSAACAVVGIHCFITDGGISSLQHWVLDDEDVQESEHTELYPEGPDA